MNYKKVIGVFFASVFILSPLVTSAKEMPIKRFLQRGMTGGDITSLQQFLSEDKEVYPEGLVTGYFGPSTEKAVKKFQKKYNISQVGVVGPLTLAKLSELFASLASSSTSTSNYSIVIIQNGAGKGNNPATSSKKEREDDDRDDDNDFRGKDNREQKVTLCHKSKETIRVDYHALPAHFGHGDSVGVCVGGGTATTTLSLSAVRAEASVNSANIFWTTNINADGMVWYATSSPVIPNSSALKVYDGVLKLSHNTLLSNLTPDTNYFYRVVSKGVNGQIATSSEYQFKTSASDTTAPLVYAVSVSGLNASTTINWLTNESATSTVWYSTTADVMSDVNKKSVGSNTPTLNHSLVLADLKPNTTYKFVIVVRDASGNITTSTSNLYTFTTGAFSLSGLNSIPGSGSALVNWNTSWASDTKIWYSTSTPVLSAVNLASMYNSNPVAIHNVNLLGLATSTTYYYLAVSKDAEGTVATSSEQSFVTLP